MSGSTCAPGSSRNCRPTYCSNRFPRSLANVGPKWSRRVKYTPHGVALAQASCGMAETPYDARGTGRS